MFMYNRYTPQPDGTYKRKSIPIISQVNSTPPEKPAQECVDEHPSHSISDFPKQRTTPKHNSPHRRPEVSAGSFLKDLLPKNLDTGDLLIIILLLLMASDANDDNGNAMFTLALYLFM